MIELVSVVAILGIVCVIFGIIFGISTTFTRKGIQDLTESIKRLRQSVESFTDFKADSFSGKVLSDGCLEITFLKDLGQILDGKESGRRGQYVRVTLPRDMWKAISHPDGPSIVLGLQKDLEQEESK